MGIDWDKHRKNPRHHYRPHLFNYSATLRNQSGLYEIFMDIDPKEQIRTVHYICPEDKESLVLLSGLSEWFEGKKISETEMIKRDLLQVTYENFISMPIFNPVYVLIQNILDQYRGKFPALNNVKDLSSSGLICRCFGVFRTEIEKLVEVHPQIDLKELSDHTLAGVGCTTCMDDVLSTIQEVKLKMGTSIKLGQKYNPMIQGLTPAQVIIKIDHALVDFFQQKDSHVELEIIDLEGFVVKAKLKSGQLSEFEYYKHELEIHIKDSLGAKFHFDIFRE